MESKHLCPVCKCRMSIVKEREHSPDGYSHDMWKIFCISCGLVSTSYPADNFFEEFHKPYYETEEAALNKFDEDCAIYSRLQLNRIINRIMEVV